MANISAIKLPSGTTYNIKDSISGYTTNTGTITQVKTTAGAHTTINVSSGAATFNVPTKTSHLTNDSGFLTSHQTLYEANLNWGGKNFSASYGPIDAAMIGQLGANRFAFLKAAGLTIEYSTDGGSSWTDYGATNTQKTGLFGYGQSFYLGKHTAAGSSTLNDQLRVTIATSAAGLYTTLNKIAIYMSTSGNTVQVKIERALESTPTTYTTHLDWTGISGWSGWNILNITGLTTYGNAPASQNGRVRFTFKQTAVTTTYSAASISQIMGFGGVGWSVPSNMARDGHLYKYDNDQNATFPAKVTATSFSGPLTGDVTGNVTGNVSGTAANVTGTVAIANGGTGQTTAANAINALLNGLPTWTADPTDSTYFIRQDTGGSATYGKVKASTIWNYISGKLPAWSKASTKPSYTFSEIGSKPTTLSGYGITDAKIQNGTITLGNNTITPLTSFTETDPVFSASAAAGITSTDINNWNTQLFIRGEGSDSIVVAGAEAGTPTATGALAISVGSNSIASGDASLAGGAQITMKGIRYVPTASGAASIAWGIGSIASGMASFAMGSANSAVGVTTASGGASVAMGICSEASNTASVAIGMANKSSGSASVALGKFTNAKEDSQCVVGKYNADESTAKFIVGNGTSGALANCFSTGIDGDSNYYLKIGQTDLTETALINLLNLTIPTNISAFTNDSGYLTSYTETDPTVPSWAKASTKPSYNFSEIGNKPTTISGYGITDAKIASGTITLGSNTITPLTSSSTLNAAKLSGAIPSAVTATTQTAGDNSTKIATTAFVSSAISTLGSVLNYKGTKATVSALPTSGNTIGDVWHVTANSGEYAWDGTEWQELGTAISIPANTGNSTTGISIAAHGTGTVIGVQSSTTTASKVTVGSSSTDYGVKSAGSASNWVFEDVACDDITAWNAGSGSGSLTFTMDTTDTKKLKIAFSHSHTVPSLSYTAKTASHVKSGGNGTAPTLGSKVPTVSATDVTVPIKNASASTFVTGTTHTVTDNGHTHTI